MCLFMMNNQFQVGLKFIHTNQTGCLSIKFTAKSWGLITIAPGCLFDGLLLKGD